MRKSDLLEMRPEEGSETECQFVEVENDEGPYVWARAGAPWENKAAAAPPAARTDAPTKPAQSRLLRSRMIVCIHVKGREDKTGVPKEVTTARSASYPNRYEFLAGAS